MARFCVCKLICLLPVVVVLYHVCAEDYTVGEIETEKIFRTFHPETKNISSDWVESLTPESLQRICDEVLEPVRKNELTGFIKEYIYTPVNASDLLTLRVIRNAPFFSFLKAEQEELTVAICVYDKIKFYLTRADDNNVFRLWQDAAGFFSLKSGLHPVHFK